MDTLLVTVGWTLAALGGLAGLVGFFWLIAVAFATSIVWGLVVLFIPLGQLVFVVRHMDIGGRPFLVSVLGTLVLWSGLAMVTSGHPPRAQHEWDPDAYRANLEAKAERDAAREAALTAPTNADGADEANAKMVDDWEGDAWVGKNLAGSDWSEPSNSADTVSADTVSADTVTSDAPAANPPSPGAARARAESEAIDFDNAWRFLDRVVRVTTREGEPVEGPLLRVTDRSLEIEAPSADPTASNRVVERSEISSIEAID